MKEASLLMKHFLYLEVISLGEEIKFSLPPSKSMDHLVTNVSGAPLDERNLSHWGVSRWKASLRAVELHDEYDIESFDLESEEFERIELPPFNANAAEEYGRPHTFLGEIGGCLCALFDYKTSADVWVMKEYGVKDSWFKLIALPLRVGQPSSVVLCPRPLLGKGPNEEIFVIFGDAFTVSSPKDGAFSRATNTVFFSEARVYVESLLSPQSNTT